MQLESIARQKADSELAERLERAQDDEIVAAVMRLSESDPAPDGGAVAEPDPSMFASRTDYRAELIRRRRERLARSLSPILETLRSMSLDVLAGGETLATIAVRGPARRLADSLALPGVEAAGLDHEIRVEPRPSRRQ